VLVQDFRRKVGAVRPHDRPKLVIHRDEREVIRIAEWLEQGPARRLDLVAEIDLTDETVGERQTQNSPRYTDALTSYGALMAVARL
jgi:hypothetical protein